MEEQEQQNLVKKLFAISDESVDEACTPENIKSFLDVMWHIPFQPLQNLLLIWKQCPTAEAVAGVEAWKKNGTALKEDAMPILVILPRAEYIEESGEYKYTADGSIATDNGKTILYEKEPQYKCWYKYVPVFDISSTGFDKVKEPPEGFTIPEIEVKIRANGYAVIPTKDEEMSDYIDEGYYCDGAIYVRESLRRNAVRYNQALINIFIESCFLSFAGDLPQDNLDLVTIMTKYVAHWFFLHDSNISVEMAAVKFEEKTHDEKKDILQYVWWWFFQFVQMVVGYPVTFDSVAILNCVLDSGSVQDMTRVLCKVQNSESAKGDEILQEYLTRAHDVVSGSGEGFLAKLYKEKMMNKGIYSYPSIIVDPGKSEKEKKEEEEKKNG